MTASPPSIEPLSAAIVSSTGFPDGTMSQTARGRRRAATKSASESTPAAPNPATRWTASRLRSYATTLWPPRPSRSVMLAPILPRPIMPSSMGLSFPSRAHDIEHLFEASLRVAAEIDRENAPLSLLERGEVAERLRADERAERVIGLGHRQVLRRLVDELQHEDGVRAALVQLPGRVEKAGAVAHRRREPHAIAQRGRKRGQRLGVARARIQIGLDRDVVALFFLSQPRRDSLAQRGRARDENLIFRLRRLLAAFSRHRLLGEVLGELDVRLIERMNPDRGASGGDGRFPAEELLADVDFPPDVDASHGMRSEERRVGKEW